MHYRDGTEAKVGDTVKFKRHAAGGVVDDAGLLTHITVGSQSCNGQVYRVRFHYPEPHAEPLVDTFNHCVTLGDCELLFRPGAEESKPTEKPATEAAPAQA